MKKIKIINYIIFLICISCGAGVGDITEDLGGGYTYISEGSYARISPSNVFKDGIYPNVREYSFDNKFIIVKQHPSQKDVTYVMEDNIRMRYGFLLYEKNILEIDENVKKFEQSFLWSDSILHKKLSSQILPNNDIKNTDSLTIIISDILKSDPYFKRMFAQKINYYIIDKAKQEVYGPFSRKEFINKRRYLKVSNKLQFETN